MTDLLIPDEIKDALDAGADLAISISGGKDSDALAVLLVALHQEQGWTGKLELVHADLGRAEWKQTSNHVEKLAERLELPLHVVARPQGDMVTRWEQRHETRPEVPPWSSAKNRFCTSDLKTSQVDKYLRRLTPEGTVICALGIRAQESPARAKKPVYVTRKAISTRKRTAFTWNPLFNFSEEDVWQALGTSGRELQALRKAVTIAKSHGESEFSLIQEASWNAHPAYVLGNARLSCAICILATQSDIANGIEYQPELYRRLVDLEIKSGFSFKNNMWLADLRPDLLTAKQNAAICETREEKE